MVYLSAESKSWVMCGKKTFSTFYIKHFYIKRCHPVTFCKCAHFVIILHKYFEQFTLFSAKRERHLRWIVHTGEFHCKVYSFWNKRRGGGGQTHFGVRPTRNPGQTDPESESDWPGIRVRKTFWTHIPVIFTRIPDQSDPGMGLAPWNPFPGQIWPGSF